MEFYKVLMTYPNGRVEEVEETFYSVEEAKKYADQLVLQVGYNAKIKGERKVKCRYSVIEKKDGESNIVFDSDM